MVRTGPVTEETAMDRGERTAVSVVALESLTWQALAQRSLSGGLHSEELAQVMGLPVALIEPALRGLLAKGLIRRAHGQRLVAVRSGEQAAGEGRDRERLPEP